MGRKDKKQNRRAKGDRTAGEIKEEILVEIRNVILYRNELSQPTTSLAYEQFQGKILTFAGTVYHLKDRLHQWCLKRGLTLEPTIEDQVKSSTFLSVCGDLVNKKKHGRSQNNSGLGPFLSHMMFSNVAAEMRFDGQMKNGTIGHVPVEYNIEIFAVKDGTEGTLGNAARYISKAFLEWMPVLTQTGILRTSDDLEARLLKELEPFAADEP